MHPGAGKNARFRYTHQYKLEHGNWTKTEPELFVLSVQASADGVATVVMQRLGRVKGIGAYVKDGCKEYNH